jgi:hypothetical protein
MTMRTILRQYPDGEVIALFPDEPANEDGSWCMAWLQTGVFYGVDPAEVMKTTKPADESVAVKKALRKLEKHPHMKKVKRKPAVEKSKVSVQLIAPERVPKSAAFKERLIENQWMMR